MTRRGTLVAGLAALLLIGGPATSAAAAGGQRGGHGAPLAIQVLSSSPSQVSGGDALLRVRLPAGTAPAAVRVTRNGADVTAAFAPDPGGRSLTGLVGGLAVGWNTVRATAPRARAALRLRDFPITGPIFSGPHQYPLLCKTERNGLGQPLVDNQDREGMRVFAVDANGDKTDQVVGWSRDCSARTTVDYLYRNAAGEFKALPADGARPADLAQTTTLDGKTVDYVVRRERGTINRFIYSIAMLAPLGEDPARQDDGAWNRRVIYRFDGGVAIGHDQGSLSTGGSLYHDGLSKGYAVIYSSGTRTSTHYNLIVGGETALMTKERFIEGHGVPFYTVGVGGSGGAIQQYIYGQNHGTRVIDAAIPQYSYPDMVTQTIHVGDCELLERYMDTSGNPKWQTWSNRRLLEGLNASDTVPNPFNGNRPGSTECIAGWRGLTPLALNPNWTDLNDAEWDITDPPGVKDTVKWTHWDDARNVYGVGADGFARVPWDNVGVQYGLGALRDGAITPAEFLDLNAKVGTWRESADMVKEGCPYEPQTCADPAQFDPWSARNMRLSPDGGLTPAPRRTGDAAAIRAARTGGLVFTGRIDLPIIDWRHYLEDELDMHNSHQSFAGRQRMLNFDGDARNQVIWFTDARPARQFDQTPEALAVMDAWMTGIRTHPERGVAGNKPPLAVDRCFDTQGNPIASGPGVWDGILDRRAPGACTQRFPLHSTSRIVAGGPIEGGVFKCPLQGVDEAIARGVYGSWRPSAEEAQRLKQIFPTGVCDYAALSR
ncbi:MAG TPA: DUF6351 family protein [Streptosporangiaceae bacterium]|nr:DUF6351 family protein [Streptosporangiaceae bacterium]